MTVGGRGWLPSGVEANAYSEGTETPPDLKESFAVGADLKTGDAEVDDFWFPDNVWPAEVTALEQAVQTYLGQMRELAETLLTIAAAALEQQPGFFTDKTAHSTHTMNINWYPPVSIVGEPEPGQFRIGPHTDFGTFTILDREPGKGGLQVWSPDGDWEDAPTTRRRSPSTPATCWPAGAATGGSRTGTGCCRRRPRRPTRTWCRWCTSTRPTGTRSSSRCNRRSARPTTTRR